VARYCDLLPCDDHVAASRNHELAYRMNESLDALYALCEQQGVLYELAYRMIE
jgi:hypothetical protein